MKYIFSVAMIVIATNLFSQVPYNAALPNGYTKKAMVAEQVGLTQVSITYHRPSVSGRDGKIWGGLVHKGFIVQGFGNGNAAPWRAGANENTIIEIDNDVMVEGQPLAKGKYALFIGYDPVECVVVFSRRSDGWGSFFYDEKDDALRVKVKPQPIAESIENLKYEFIRQTPNSAVVALSWEKLLIPFKIEVDHLKQQFDALASGLQNPVSFTPQALNAAASWSLQNKYQMDKGLEWAKLATGTDFPGDPTSFAALSTKAALLDKLGKANDAAAIMKNALPYGTMMQLQQYGRQQLNAKKFAEALAVFSFNYDKNPDQFVTMMGMVRGLSATGDYAKALAFAQKALPLAPNDANKQAVNVMIEKLKAGKDVN